MNYKLINRTTGEETICSKVVIDGFDYYVSDDEINNLDWIIETLNKVLFQVKFENNDYSNSSFKKVIATNNPSIDLPKVVDTLYFINELYPKAVIGGESNTIERKQQQNAFSRGYHHSQESHPYSEEDMIEFLEFHQKTAILSFSSTTENHGKSYKELLQIWKEQKPKIVYYE